MSALAAATQQLNFYHGNIDGHWHACMHAHQLETPAQNRRRKKKEKKEKRPFRQRSAHMCTKPHSTPFLHQDMRQERARVSPKHQNTNNTAELFESKEKFRDCSTFLPTPPHFLATCLATSMLHAPCSMFYSHPMSRY